MAVNPWGVSSSKGNESPNNGGMNTNGKENAEGEAEGGSQKLHVLRVADLVAFCRLRGIPQVLPMTATTTTNGIKAPAGGSDRLGGLGAESMSSSSSLLSGNNLEVHQRSLRSNTNVYVKELDKLDPFIKRHSEDGMS